GGAPTTKAIPNVNKRAMIVRIKTLYGSRSAEGSAAFITNAGVFAARDAVMRQKTFVFGERRSSGTSARCLWSKLNNQGATAKRRNNGARSSQVRASEPPLYSARSATIGSTR